jgi:HK97 gp10 family phage protein
VAFAIRGKVDGLEDLKRALAGVDGRVRKKALRKGVNAAAGVILKRARQKVPVRLGLLKKSLGRKVKVYRKEGAVVGIVGPRTGFRRQVGTTKDGRPVFENPTQIAHLVEKGTRRSRAKPFMRPALEESRGDVSSAVAEAVQAELGK